jgi:hypothetical protein
MGSVRVDFFHPFIAIQFNGDKEGQALAPQVCAKLFSTQCFWVTRKNGVGWGEFSN